jgi:hypothetical protein
VFSFVTITSIKVLNVRGSPSVKQGPGVSHTTISTRSEYVFTRTYENLSSGDVNPGSNSSRHGLLEGSLYHEICTMLSIMRLIHDRAPRAWGPRNVLWLPFHKT